MIFKIRIYKSEKKLCKPFNTASGSLRNKIIYQVVIFDNKKPVFIYELPLSPSLGEMPVDIEIALKKYQDNAFKVSPHLKRALSWTKILTHKWDSFNQIPLKTISLETFGIDEWPSQKLEHLIRLKCNLKCLDKLVSYSSMIMNDWCVDFNGSLDKKGWDFFNEYTNLNRCQWVEQPFHPKIYNFDLIQSATIPVFADEEMSNLNAVTFKKSPFKGFILKPIRHDFQVFVEWIKLAKLSQIPCIIGSPICDIVSLSLCKILNKFCTIVIETEVTPQFPFYGNEFSKEIFYMENDCLKLNKDTFDYINANYHLIYQSNEIMA